MVAAIALTIGFIVGTSLAVMSGFIGGWVDEIVMRIVDIWMSIPFLMVALVLVIVVGQSMTTLLGLLAMMAWVHFVRVIRGQTLQLKEMDYISLARVAGSSQVRIMFRHIFPGIVNTAMVIATLRVGQLIMAEATLSFLGAGIPPPAPAWGVMVGEARSYLDTAWWTSVFPGVCIFLTVMALNFLGDWMRDRFDPRLRQL
jgi:peptide/nickel transport system permease protein